jgi:hypothetical protein
LQWDVCAHISYSLVSRDLIADCIELMHEVPFSFCTANDVLGCACVVYCKQTPKHVVLTGRATEPTPWSRLPDATRRCLVCSASRALALSLPQSPLAGPVSPSVSLPRFPRNFIAGVLMPIARGNNIGITLYGGTAHSGNPATREPHAGEHKGKRLTPGSPYEAVGSFSKGMCVCHPTALAP